MLNLAFEFLVFEVVGAIVQILCIILATIQSGFEISAVYGALDLGSLNLCNDAIECALCAFDVRVGDDVCVGIGACVIDNGLYANDNFLQVAVGGIACILVVHLALE